ncbi:type I-E CRISPR-associated protein Cas6/Cse3/CasE [Corynebacterium ulcerans]|uniref:type I-E CRISPR-associated protein Cas6/Cse3/CasE n=1 Tax=Corynebacterium ulcerans TaxID=65058 RepID=UPI000C78444D|nr:type I-E CRISPR-associated protein Cas6/Cse3/CasE [Corynebacterium ulcerans]PLW02606.1 type I-E CRISPR-associated protein Cas6/Cse3/CasE [Corynebacterium ulcerans]
MPNTIYWTSFPAHIALNKSLVLGDSATQDSKNKPRWDVDDPVFRHRAVMALFPEHQSDNARADSNILFRLEALPGQPPYFFVQSSIEPSNRNLDNHIKTRQVDLVSPEAGTPIEFRLSINAVRRKTIDATENTKRKIKTTCLSLKALDSDPTETAAGQWVKEKLSPALENIDIVRHGRQVLGANRNGEKTSNRTVQVDTIDGFAHVKDPAELQKILIHGIGRAKSYGCGMLTFRPI